MQEVDESALVNIKVSLSPAVSPRGEKLQRELNNKLQLERDME